MTDLLAVKVSTSAPAGATAVATFAFSNRLNKIDGVKKAAAERAGFTGKPGSTLTLNDGDKVRVVLGLGPSGEAGAGELRTAVAAFVRGVSKHRRAAVDLVDVDLEVDEERAAAVVAEGAILANYSFDELKSDDDAGPSLSTLTIATEGDLRGVRAAVAKAVAVADGVCFARDMVNLPGGDLTPERFARLAAERAEAAGLQVEVLDETAIVDERLGGVIAVNKGSEHPARLVKLTYTPDDEVAAGGETVALVGKGITFDSGGLSLKPPDGMIGMKMDMGGAAAVLGAMCALPAVGAPVRVVSYTPMTDNMTGPDAQRPGDVYTARDGTTVEVLNTDAEGRLILGDALALASEEEPAAIIDLATLTGACLVALGDRIAGLMSNDDELSERIARAADEAGERVWPLPLPDDYAKQLESDIADVKNIGTRFGGTLTAGLFLKKFVGEGIPWAHIDIAGPGMGNEAWEVVPKGGTGFGVRTLVRLISDWLDDPADVQAPQEG
ncbi:MAG: leucyl aminopeptidase [Actinomycetia bacterium]|nr:leucyl aminopeptidase [Actinomycetes bacterium]